MADKLFDTEPLLPDRQPVSARTGQPLSKRTLAQRASERRRLAAMHARHGHGPEGQTCRDCTFLLQREYTKMILKCQRYNVTSSEATDWRAGCWVKFATKLCDGPHAQVRGKTCDKPICEDCATSGGPNIDFCSDHKDPKTRRLAL